jgi:hypothetical protein
MTAGFWCAGALAATCAGAPAACGAAPAPALPLPQTDDLTPACSPVPPNHCCPGGAPPPLRAPFCTRGRGAPIASQRTRSGPSPGKPIAPGALKRDTYVCLGSFVRLTHTQEKNCARETLHAPQGVSGCNDSAAAGFPMARTRAGTPGRRQSRAGAGGGGGAFGARHNKLCAQRRGPAGGVCEGEGPARQWVRHSGGTRPCRGRRRKCAAAAAERGERARTRQAPGTSFWGAPRRSLRRAFQDVDEINMEGRPTKEPGGRGEARRSPRGPANAASQAQQPWEHPGCALISARWGTRRASSSGSVTGTLRGVQSSGIRSSAQKVLRWSARTRPPSPNTACGRRRRRGAAGGREVRAAAPAGERPAAAGDASAGPGLAFEEKRPSGTPPPAHHRQDAVPRVHERRQARPREVGVGGPRQLVDSGPRARARLGRQVAARRLGKREGHVDAREVGRARVRLRRGGVCGAGVGGEGGAGGARGRRGAAAAGRARPDVRRAGAGPYVGRAGTGRWPRPSARTGGKGARSDLGWAGRRSPSRVKEAS